MATPDKISIERAKKMHPKLRNEMLIILQEMTDAIAPKMLPRLAYTLRTINEQNDLYAQGRTKLFDANGKRLGKVTNAKGGQSYHNYGLAFDIVLLIDKDGNGTYETASWDVNEYWMKCAQIAKKYGYTWGGEFKSIVDYPHFEKTFGFTTSHLLGLKRDGEGYPII